MENDLILKGEKEISLAENAFLTKVKRSESIVLEEIRKILRVVDVSGGKLRNNEATINFLTSMEERIRLALKKGGYNDGVTGLIKNFDKIKENNIKLTKNVNGLNIAESQLSGITKLEVNNTVEKLLNSGINKDFINPVRQALYRNIVLGADISDAEKTIEDYLLTKGKKQSHLLRYTKQVARDSLSQYDGAIQSAIGNELGLDDYLYAGSLVEDSRGQCQHWVGKRRLKWEELEEEISTALRGGFLGGNKCSGMIPDTTVDTFSVYRGGYNCRHRAIRIKIK